MPDTAFTVKVDEKTFTLDRITLGDWRMFKTEFGLNASDITSTVTNDKGETVEVLNLDDPNVLIALLVAAERHARPTTSIDDLVLYVESLGMDGLEFVTADEDETAPDPTKAGDDDSEATAAQSKPGSSAKPRKKSGRQSGAKS